MWKDYSYFPSVSRNGPKINFAFQIRHLINDRSIPAKFSLFPTKNRFLPKILFPMPHSDLGRVYSERAHRVIGADTRKNVGAIFFLKTGVAKSQPISFSRSWVPFRALFGLRAVSTS
jgi:hypothetical protein